MIETEDDARNTANALHFLTMIRILQFIIGKIRYALRWPRTDLDEYIRDPDTGQYCLLVPTELLQSDPHVRRIAAEFPNMARYYIRPPGGGMRIIEDPTLAERAIKELKRVHGIVDDWDG